MMMMMTTCNQNLFYFIQFVDKQMLENKGVLNVENEINEKDFILLFVVSGNIYEAIVVTNLLTCFGCTV